VRFQKWHVFFGRGQQQRRQQTKLYIIHTSHSYIIYKYKRGFRFMVHHHHYNQRPFSSRPPQGFFSFIIITILLLFSLPFHALVCVCVYLRLCVYTVSSLYRKSSEHTSLISHFRYAHTDTNTHTYTGDLETCTVSGFRSLAGPTNWNWHVDRRGFLGLLDRNENIAPKLYVLWPF